MTRPALLVPLAGILTLSSVAGAQSRSQDDENRLRNDCRLATQVIETGVPAPKTEWAFATIGSCSSDQQARSLASAWARPTNGTSLEVLAARSASIADARLLRATVAVATSPDRSVAERIAALNLVTHYLKPGWGISPEFWERPDRFSITIWPDSPQEAGDEPITDADRQAAHAALQAMSTSTTDRLGAPVAARLLAALSLRE